MKKIELRAYLSFFRIRFAAGLQYRAAAWAGILTQFCWGALEILLFRAFYRAGASAFPMEFSQLSSYIWLSEAFLSMLATYFFENELLDSISNGGIGYELCRPASLYGMWFTRNAAARVSRALLRCLPILLVSALLPAPYGLSFPAGPGALLLFLLSLISGLLVAVSLCMLVCVLTFFTVSPAGLRIFYIAIGDFLSGGLIPIPFFPAVIQPLINLLPFASIQNTPFFIYSGYISGTDAVWGILLQIGWIAVLNMLGVFLMRRALRRVVVQGG